MTLIVFSSVTVHAAQMRHVLSHNLRPILQNSRSLSSRDSRPLVISAFLKWNKFIFSSAFFVTRKLLNQDCSTSRLKNKWNAQVMIAPCFLIGL